MGNGSVALVLQATSQQRHSLRRIVVSNGEIPSDRSTATIPRSALGQGLGGLLCRLVLGPTGTSASNTWRPICATSARRMRMRHPQADLGRIPPEKSSAMAPLATRLISTRDCSDQQTQAPVAFRLRPSKGASVADATKRLHTSCRQIQTMTDMSGA